MDNGEEIPCLGEEWSFAGCKAMELASGLVSALIFQEVFLKSPAQSMPLVVSVMISVPLMLAAIRKTYPDEERGLRNHIMTMLGLAPPGIPAPARLQPIWSNAPLRELPEKTQYQQLELDKLFEKAEEGESES